VNSRRYGGAENSNNDDGDDNDDSHSTNELAAEPAGRQIASFRGIDLMGKTRNLCISCMHDR